MSGINILLTFDYELPLGGIHGSFGESLFEPAGQVIHLAEEMGVSLNFFADILCYQKFNALGRSDFAAPFARQLQEALAKGHDVQLHLHPHWIDTRIEGDTFFPSANYGLHNFRNNPPPLNIQSIINQGVEGLKSLLAPVNPNYACIAYRGGGYVLQPATQEILNALFAEGIRIDSTISNGYYFKSDRSFVDYTAIPNKANWFLNMDGQLNKENNLIEGGGIFEIPIASKPKSLFELPTSLKLKFYGHRAPQARGIMVHEPPASLSLQERKKALLSARMLTFDNFTYSKNFPLKILRYHLKKFRNKEPIYLSVVSHPKAMGAYSLDLMKHFIEKVRNEYGQEVSFKTFTQVKEDLNL